ncbi:MAG TPA: hypothetical protein VGM05_11480 [Planctomycetaceae bacterium]
MKPSQRKFYRTVIQIEVLSEEPFASMVLEDIAEAVDEGPCSGRTKVRRREVVDGPTMAKLLDAQGSDPGFFNLTDVGEDTDDG